MLLKKKKKQFPMRKSEGKFKKNTTRQMIMKTQPFKIYRMWQKQCLQRKVHSNTGLPQKRRKILNQQLNLPPKRIRKRRTKKT